MTAIAKTPEDHPISPATQADNVLALISRAAADPACDMDKMERLMAMHDRMKAQQAEQEFNAAMSRAQAAMGRISADAVNPQTRSAYATYGKLDSKLRPIYTREGFALSFSTGHDAPEGYVRVLCFVSHTAGHTRTYSCDMPADGKGAKGNDVMTKTHAAGSAMTYGQRYLLKLIFNVAIGEHDDDGNGASDDYDPTEWLDAIADAADKSELDALASELKQAKGIPSGALKAIRQAWAARAKELSK